MRSLTVTRNCFLWLAGLALISCGGRAVDASGPDDPSTGGNGGGGSTGGSVGAGGGSTGGNGGAGGSDTGGVGGTTVGAGGWTGGVGGTVGSGGSTGGSGGSGGAGGGWPCSTGGSGGPIQDPSANGSRSNSLGASGSGGWPDAGVSRDATFWESGVPNDGGACYCTRRPGPGVSIRCAAGIDESATGIIGPAGGSISVVGRQGIASGVAFALTVAPRTFERDLAVTVTETSIPPPVEFTDWSPIYEIAPACVRVPSIMKLRVPWGNKDGVVSRGLTLYYAKDRSGPFTPVPDAYVNAGFLDAGITEFGFFFAGALKTPDQLACP